MMNEVHKVLRRRHQVCLFAWSYCQLQFAHMQLKKNQKNSLILIHIICHIRSMNAVTINTLLYIVYTQVGHSQNDSQTQTHMQNNLLMLQNCRVLSRRVFLTSSSSSVHLGILFQHSRQDAGSDISM